MRRWVLVPWFCCVAAASAAAQPASPGVEFAAVPAAGPQRPLVLGYGALPGGLHAPIGDTLPRGMFAFAALGGYGWRSGLVGEDHRLSRRLGDLGFAFAPADVLSIALELDGRHDRHSGVTPEGDDDYVGDPRVIARLAKATGAAALGGQLTLWLPGGKAPSVATEAISVEARGLASIHAGAGTFGFSAGFRFDNSAKSVDDPQQFRAHERVSLGVSEYHAVVGSAYAGVAAGRVFFGAEGSVELFVGGGSDPPGPLLRAGIHGGLHLGQVSVLLFAELAKVPAIDEADLMADDFALIAYEPMITGGLGVQGRFGGKPKRAGLAPHVKANDVKEDVRVIEYAEIVGTATDEAGKPIVGATVTAKLKAHTATGVTDPGGEYTIKQIPIGKTVNGVTTLDDTDVEVTISVADRKPAQTTSTLIKGRNQMAKLELPPILVPSELRAVVSDAVTGKPITGATVAIEPGGVKATTGADGTLSVQLAPGIYKATATAPGRKPQTLDVQVDSHGVHIKNFELRKQK
jgi:hypothetical protein